MFGVGASELLVIAVVALLVVGPKKLPDMAKSLGKGFSEFRKATEGVTEGIKDSLREDEPKQDLPKTRDSLLYGTEDNANDAQPPVKPAEDEKRPNIPADPSSSAHS